VKSVRLALEIREAIQHIPGKGYRFAGPHPRWYDLPVDRAPVLVPADPPDAPIHEMPPVPASEPVRAVPVARRRWIAAGLLLLFAVAVPVFSRVLTPADTSTPPIVFVSGAAEDKEGERIANGIGRDVSDLVFNRVSSTLATAAPLRRLIEGCDWLAMFVPEFPDELLAPGQGPPALAYPLPMPEMLHGAFTTAVRIEPRPTLEPANPSAPAVAASSGLADSWWPLSALRPGRAREPEARTISCWLTSAGPGRFVVAVNVASAAGKPDFGAMIHKDR